jgi:DNA recombination protein RmuC
MMPFSTLLWVLGGMLLGMCAACVVLWREIVSLRSETQHTRMMLTQTHTDHMAALQNHASHNNTATHQQLESIRTTMHERLSEVTSSVSTRLAEQHHVITHVQKQLGGLAETAQHIQTLGKDIASLQHLLKAPKMRGQLGETLLEDMLQQVLPKEAYRLQHRFNNTLAVDAAIQLGNKWVPIDCKFPLEAYQRLTAEDVVPQSDAYKKLKRAFIDTLRKHVASVAEKYIRPECNTYDFALVYLPAESLYYEAIVRTDPSDPSSDTLSFAAQHKIVLVSPNTFYAYLLTVAYGLKGLHIEQQAQILRSQLSGFQNTFSDFQKNVDKTTRQIELAYKNSTELQRQSHTLQDTLSHMLSNTSTPTGQ